MIKFNCWYFFFQLSKLKLKKYAHLKYMYKWSAKQQFPNFKTVGGVICTIGVPFLQPPTWPSAHHFYYFNNWNFPLENWLKKVLLPPLLSCPIDVKTIYQFGTSSFLFGNTVVRWIINSFYSIKNGNFLILQPQCWERASKQYLKDGLMHIKVNIGINFYMHAGKRMY